MIDLEIVPGITMRVTEAEIERLHMETMGWLRMFDEARALEAFQAAEGEEPEGHL